MHLKSSVDSVTVGVMDSDGLLSVGDVAARCGIAPSAVRYYADQGLIDSERTDGGQRRFRRETIRRVAFIGAARRVGRSLAEIRSALEGLPRARTPTHADWAAIGEQWRARLDEQIDELEALRDQLDACIGCGCLSLERCGIYNPDDAASRLGSGPRYLLGDSAEDVAPSF